MSRPRGDHEAQRARIGRAAADVIATRGLEQLTLRELAAALGVTTGVLTHYFPSKSALVTFTKELVFDAHFRAAQSAAEGLEGMEALCAVLREVLPMDAERRTSWRVLAAFLGSAIGSAPLQHAHAERMARWFALFDTLVRPLMRGRRGTMRRDPAHTGQAIALLVEGMAMHWAMQHPPPPAEWQFSFACAQVQRLVPEPPAAATRPRRRRPPAVHSAR